MEGWCWIIMTRPNTTWCIRKGCSYLTRHWVNTAGLKQKIRKKCICTRTGRQPGIMDSCPMEDETEILRRDV